MYYYSWVHAACGWRCIPGGPCDVSIDDSSVQQAALSAAVQKQVVKGIRFLVDLNLCRTMCRKRDKAKNLSDCGLQPPGPLHQVSTTARGVRHQGPGPDVVLTIDCTYLWTYDIPNRK
uniref:Uncharacterized protein n=1 Tax=Periophthalmus magnuspinnatus TaxID=409849 RepID=A0A3B3Z7H4_9GOBI